ncbi:MAG: TetR/AcrR family transcriptional regulator [Lachnospiraceae bacterium]|jgi:AcrR family transcriptional regulator|nr:TetR/AcrR family transcriptional regulator [Lachnospiraceae bacterium]MCI9109350.1 TetR/AcrR family transcriptional regulator [Lachnospiraceae bacterium]
MGKIDINKKLKEDALLNTAFDLFTKQGIHKTSISDIVNQAGVAKGTFYLYFKDKYDINNKLIAKKASQIFRTADEALHRTDITGLEDQIIFMIDNILDQFTADKSLLRFISKSLSWGIFKNELLYSDSSEIDFYNIYSSVFEKSEIKYKNPELLVFMIIELVSSTSFSCILYEEPTSISELKPYLFESVRQMMRSMEVR